ncbi:MAG: hypothetical protein EAZ43_10570 [Betaproteobacteria bacterium]|nr:MAG: hypothetical protein EAZ43_10570 [Betaproteobacteria bacterium]
MNSYRYLSLTFALIVAFALSRDIDATMTPSHNDANLQGDVRQFGRWAVGCSNLRSCTAIVPLNQPSVLDPPHYLHISFSGAPGEGDSVSVMRNGRTILVISKEAAHQLTQDLRKPVGPGVVDLTFGGQEFAVPSDGFARVMLALEVWSSKPSLNAMSPAPVTPLPASRLQKLVPPPKLISASRRCPDNRAGRLLEAWRGANGQVLWHATCDNEGLNLIGVWQLTNRRQVTAVDRYIDGRNATTTLYNSWFDADTGYLRTTHYFGRHDSYQEDCGVYQVYAWGIEGMKLVEQRSMPQCGTGISPEGWIVVYRAAVLNGPDPGP